MRQTILSLLFLSFVFRAWAQGPSSDKAEVGDIHRVKALLISSLDLTLPKVTMEFFLKYEGQGAPIKWEVTECGQSTRDAEVDHGSEVGTCVQAGIDLKDGRSATVVISIGKRSKKPADVPAIHGVRVSYPGGTIHRLDRLSDLPMELHRPLPKGPKDLSTPVSIGLVALALGSGPHAFSF